MGYLMLNLPPVKRRKRCNLIIHGDEKVDHTIPKGISPKVNVIAWLEFELVYYHVTVQLVNRDAMVISLPGFVNDIWEHLRY